MIFFNVPQARQQLVTKGFVYTLRPKTRKTGTDLAVYGSYYKHQRIGDVSIDFIKEVEDQETWVCPECGRINETYTYPTHCSRCGYLHYPNPNMDEVREYLSSSGFERLKDWWEAAEGSRFLFRVGLASIEEAKIKDLVRRNSGELIKMCREAGLSTEGNKKDLAMRLLGL